MKQRRDTKANWAAQNPVLLAGELGLVSDDPNLYKVGDGTTAWNALPFRGFDGTLVHTIGDSETAAMSQKGVTEELAKLSAEVSELSYGNLPLVGGENAWIRHSNGEYVPSNAAKTYYFSTEHIKHIIAYLYTGASVVNVISFFSDIEATQESYMAEESIAWIGGDSDNWYVAKAPEKAKVVAVTSANNDSFTPLLYVSAGDYLGYISAKEEENFNAILKGWVESESFAYTSISKDGNGFVTQASIVYPNGATGILKITRDVDGNAIVVTATHILNSITKTITYSIKRDAEGQVISTTININ